jgi:DNA-binding MarR family transcriptional regulator
MSVPIERLFSETRRVYQALDQAAGETCATLGLTSAERALLELLDREHTPLGIAELALAALTPRTELVPVLRHLQARGWVDLRTTDTGAGGHEVVLNVAGRELCQRLRSHELALLQRLEAAVDERALQSTFATLRSVRRLLRRTGPAGNPCAP